MSNPKRHEARNLVHHEFFIGAVDASEVKTVRINLGGEKGERHSFTNLIAEKRGLASAGETLLIKQAHNGNVANPTWITCLAASLSALMTSPASAADMFAQAAPTAPWVELIYTNGETPQAAVYLALTAQ